MSLDLPSLEIFRRVARTGSVTLAAAQLNRVQSNVSTRVRQLEDTLGVKLFTRGNRRLTLTDEGRNLLPYAEKMLTLSREAADAVRGEAPYGGFRIGTMESTAVARLPRILSAYHAEHPAVELQVTTDTAGALLNRLRSNEIDVAFVAEPVSADIFTSEPVFREELVLVSSPSGGPLAGAGALDGRTVIAFEEGCAYRRYLNDWLLEEGCTPGTVLSVGSYPAMLACVSAGTGISLVPRSVLETIDLGEPLRQRTLGGHLSQIETLLVRRSGYASPKLEALRRILAVGAEIAA